MLPAVAEPVALQSKNPATDDLSWSDAFFEGDPSVVAVFDYDLEKLYEQKIAGIVGPMVGALVSVGMFSLFLSMVTAWPYVWIILLLLGAAGCAIPVLRENYKGRYPYSSFTAEGPHTAVTRDAVRYVQPATENRAAFALEVPFGEIVSIKIEQLPADPKLVVVCLNLASTDDGLEYIKSGYFRFGKQPGTSSVQLRLVALREPVRFKKLVMEMKGEPLFSKMNDLALRIQAIADGDASNPELNQVLTEVAAELRVLLLNSV